MKYKCLICGEVFEVENGQEPVCPVCGGSGNQLETVTE